MSIDEQIKEMQLVCNQIDEWNPVNPLIETYLIGAQALIIEAIDQMKLTTNTNKQASEEG